MTRRDFLRALAAAALLPLVPGVAAAAGRKAPPGKPAKKKPEKPKKPDKIQRVDTDARGTTFTLRLDHAPFPCPGSPYQDATVLVFVPAFYRARGGADLVVHFHGHHNTAGDAMRGMQLREQLHDSKQNAVLVVPQGPVRAADSSGGRLEKRGALRRLLAEVLRVLQTRRARTALGRAAVPNVLGRVYLSAHSGGYRVAARCLEHGGVPGIAEAWLFDALYGELDTYRAWILKKNVGRKLVSFYTDDGGTRALNERLIAELRKARLRVFVERSEGQLTRAQLTQGRAVFIRAGASHSGTTFRMNNFRDVLYASSLRRYVDSDWFTDKNARRKVERRR